MPPAPAAPVPAQPKNGLGTAGFVLGLVGLIFAFIPLIGVVAWPLTILGLVFGIIGTVRARSGAANNKGIAISGLVLSIIGLVICIIWAAAFGKAVSDAPKVSADASVSEMPPAVASVAAGASAAASVAPNSGSPAQVNAPAAAGKHTVVLEVTTAAKSNVQYTSGLTVNKQDVIDSGKTWTQNLSMDDLAFTTISVTPVSYQGSTKPNTCKITVDGKKAAENSNPIGAICTYTP